VSSDLEKWFVLRDAVVMEKLCAFLRGNFQAMADRGQPLMVHVSEYAMKRSVEQSRAYWRMVQNVSEDAWIDGKQYPKDVWHEFFRKRFLPLLDGPEGMYPTSTTTLSVKEFSDYMEQVHAFAASDLGVEI
jgi:NinB protein